MPAAAAPLFQGDELEKWAGVTFLLLTVTDDGWPHVAMLSVGEVLSTSPRGLRVALWPTSTTTANLTRAGQATLAFVHANTAYSLRCSARRAPDIRPAPEGPLAVFELRIEAVLEDVAPYAELTGGVTYRLKEPEQVWPRRHATIEALRRSEHVTESR